MTPLHVATLIGMVMTPLHGATLIGMVMTPLRVATLIGINDHDSTSCGYPDRTLLHAC